MLIEMAHAATSAAEATAESPVGVLGINLKLFIAQIVNFAVVLFVLWKWAYRPLVAKLNERTAKIEKGLQDAKLAETDRTMAMEKYNETVAEGRRQADELIAQAHEQGEALLKQTEAKAEAKVHAMAQEARETMQKEREHMEKEVKDKMVAVAVAMSEKILGKKFDGETDTKFIDALLK